MYGASPVTEIVSLSVRGPCSTVRWAMPAPIMTAASTKAVTAQTKRT
jgi:hypothetical protein